MSRKERQRLEVLSRVRDGQLTVAAAAELLGVGERQAWRLKRRYSDEGDAGLVHKLRGRRSNRKTGDAVRSAVLALYREKYAGWGPTLACEYLAKEDGHRLSHDTLGRWLRQEGLYERRRRRGKHRRRRPRRKHRGELVQMDGSWHDWFEGRGPWCCLMVLVDDATGTTFARFYEKETLAAAFDAFGRYAKEYGLPRAVYVDKAGIYRPDERGEPTQFGRAMAELGVELILADSPQAKGRVERKNAVFQDRLVKEMTLRGVGDVAAANALLDGSGGPNGSFLAELNDRFGVGPAKKADLHRKVAAGVRLDEVLCVREERAVGRDWCVQWRGRLMQVDASHAALDLPRPGRRVTVLEKAGGEVLLRYDGHDLTWQEVTRRPEKTKPPKRAKPAITNNKRWMPPDDHPWRRDSPRGRRAPAAGAAAAAAGCKPLVGSASSGLVPAAPDSSIASKRVTVLKR